MKKLVKVVLVAAVLLVALIAAAVFFVFKNLNSIVKTGTEKALTFALQVPCTVGAADVDVGAGSIQLDDIHIPNPKGYKSAHAMHFGVVRVEADIQSFRTDKGIIHLVRLSEADIVLEKSTTSSNIQDLMKNAQRLSSGEAAPEEPKDEASKKKVVIEKLIMDGTTVGVQIPIVEQTYKVQLPDVEKENIGGDDKAITPAEALEQILAVILGSIKNAGSGILPDDLLGDIGDSLKGLKEYGSTATDAAGKIAEDTVNTVKDAVGGAGDTAKEAADDVKKSVEGLFGKKKTSE